MNATIRRAITLVELLVAVAIVTFLSATSMLVDEDVTTRNDGQFVPASGPNDPSADWFGTQHTRGANLVSADTSAKRYRKAAVVSPAMYRRFFVLRDLE